MPVFRDAQGHLYRIPKKVLESFLIEGEAEARITGAELSPAAVAEARQETPGYVWASGEEDVLGYKWLDEQMPYENAEARQEAMGYVWASGEQHVLGYQWPDEVLPYENADPSQQAANESLDDLGIAI